MKPVFVWAHVFLGLYVDSMLRTGWEKCWGNFGSTILLFLLVASSFQPRTGWAQARVVWMEALLGTVRKVSRSYLG